jgi:hypothetical protein
MGFDASTTLRVVARPHAQPSQVDQFLSTSPISVIGHVLFGPESTSPVTALIKHLALNCGNLEGKSPLNSLHFRLATQDEQ